MPSWVIPAVAFAFAVETTLITWAILTGRFVARREADTDAIAELRRRIQGEHDERKRVAELLTVRVGKLITRVAVLRQRMKNVEHACKIPVGDDEDME